MRRSVLTAGAVTAFGATHLAIATWTGRRAFAGGLWDAVDLNPTSDPDELRIRCAFWFGVGSFGAPMVLLGATMLHIAVRDHPVPRAVGWGLIAWGVPLTVMLPRSPAWLVPVMGVVTVTR